MFQTRSTELEHLDKGDYTPEEYEGCLVELRRINKWLGDASALRRSVLSMIEADDGEEFSLLDVGAGSGELLRQTALHHSLRNRRAFLVGVEMNRRSSQAIVERSRAFESINSVQADALKLPFPDSSFDYVMCSLFTHHFTDAQVVNVLAEMNRVARKVVAVIDLHRHPVAYGFYTTIGKLFLHNRLVREDGALSILRSFKVPELKALAVTAGLRNPRVRRRFPYRLVLTDVKST